MATAQKTTRKLQQRTLDTRAAIMAAGANLFATRGFAETGVRDIAEAADKGDPVHTLVGIVAREIGSTSHLVPTLLRTSGD